MKFPSQVSSKKAFVLVLVACLIVGLTAYSVRSTPPLNTLVDVWPAQPPLNTVSYIIGYIAANSTCYLKNGTTGNIDATGDFSTVFNLGTSYLIPNGGEIFVRTGKYYANTGLTIASNSIDVVGEGVGYLETGCQIVDNMTSGAALVTYSTSGTDRHWLGHFTNIFLQGRNTANSIGIKINGYWSDLWFDHVLALNFDIGAYVTAGATGEGKVWNIFFDYCMIEDCTRFGVYLTGTTDAYLRHIDRVRISNCHFYDNQNSLRIDGQYVFHVNFEGNTVERERQACINATYGRQVNIEGNQIFDCGIGTNGTYAAIYLNGQAAFSMDTWTITGNTIGNHFWSNVLKSALYLTGLLEDFSVSGNSFVNFAAKAVEYISLNSGTNHISINNNPAYNPVGYIATPVSGTFLLDYNGTGGVASGVTYTNVGSNKMIYVESASSLTVYVDGRLLTNAELYMHVFVPSGSTFSVTGTIAYISVMGS